MTVDPLPRSLVPLPGESLPGFLLRLAHRLDLSPSELVWQTGLNNGRRPSTSLVPARLLIMLEPSTLDNFAARTRMTPEQADRLTLRPYHNAYPPLTEALTGQGTTLRPRSVVPPWLTTAFPRYCPRCLAGDGSTIQQRHGGPWKVLWHLPVVFGCLDHRRLLEHVCPACKTPPGAGYHRAPTKLLAAPGAVGLHPAACRNTSNGERQSPLCQGRLDDPRTGNRITLTNDLADLQVRLLALIDRGHDLAAGRRQIADLQVMSAFVRATWPLCADYAPSPELARHMTVEAARRQEDRDEPRWDALPAAAPATAALLGAASSLLALPQPELRRELIRIARAMPLKSSQSWGKTWIRLADNCSANFRQEAQHALEWRYPIAGPVRRPDLVFTPNPCGYLPEYVPQWIPDDWLTILVESSGPTPLPRSPVFRRAAAVHLVQAMTDMSIQDAAAFLKIPKDWLEGRARLQPIHNKFRHPDYGIAGAFERLAGHIQMLPNPVDYFERRQRFEFWTIPPAEWDQVLDEAAASQQVRKTPTSSVLRLVSSAWVWSQITGSEWCLAPTMRPPLAPATLRTGAESAASKKLKLLTKSDVPTYTALRGILSQRAKQLVS